LANRAPDRSRKVFATAGKPVYEAKHIATPTIKRLGPFSKMEWPTPPPKTDALMSYGNEFIFDAGNNPYGFDIRLE